MQSNISNRKKRLTAQEIQNELMNLEERFLQDVTSGLYTLGNSLPSLNQMKEKYGASYHLARQFYSYLEKRGIVLSIRGKGVFLASIPKEETFLPNVLLYTKGILVVGNINMGEMSSTLNCDTRWLMELEDACLDLKIPFRFVNLHGLKNDASILKFRDLMERVRPAGVIFLRPNLSSFPIEEIKRCPVPYISLNVTTLDNPGVSVDEFGSGFSAASHLLKQGFRRIGFLAYPTDFHWQLERLNGYRSALLAEGIQPEAEMIMTITHRISRNLDLPREEVYHAAESLFRKCDALLCGSDIIGVLLLEYAQKQNLTPAQRPALVGFDNQFEWRGSELSSVSPAWEQQAREALRLLMEWIVAPQTKRTSVKIAGRLYIRNSSFKPEERE